MTEQEILNKYPKEIAVATVEKAGTKINLLKWTSIRTISETFVPPTDYRYPLLAEK